MVERLFFAVPPGCLQVVIVVFPDHTHLLFFFIIFSFLVDEGWEDPKTTISELSSAHQRNTI